MNRLLWSATVGSHMWKMNHKYSDTDLFNVYIQPTEEILAGHPIQKGIETKEEGKDIVSFEIGHVVDQLQKGNINFLWGLFSPLNTFGKELDRQFCFLARVKLQNIVESTLAKNFINAITGMCRANLKKYYGVSVNTEGDAPAFKQTTGCNLEKSDYKYYKKIRMMYRALLQGLKFLKDQNIEFPSAPDNLSLEALELLYMDVIAEYEECDLPEKPNSQSYDDYLVALRLQLLDL